MMRSMHDSIDRASHSSITGNVRMVPYVLGLTRLDLHIEVMSQRHPRQAKVKVARPTHSKKIIDLRTVLTFEATRQELPKQWPRVVSTRTPMKSASLRR